MGFITPEQYMIPPNKYAPNSRLPILLYRDILPLPLSEEKTTIFLEANDWEKRGVWGHISVRHFHPNTHECYGPVPSPWLSTSSNIYEFILFSFY